MSNGYIILVNWFINVIATAEFKLVGFNKCLLNFIRIFNHKKPNRIVVTHHSSQNWFLNKFSHFAALALKVRARTEKLHFDYREEI